jgi:hypothetical protein
VNTGSERNLKRRLKAIGLSEGAITAAWPQWWSQDADASPSARLELHFSIARKLGIDPRSLLDAEGTPRFVWRDEARFKHLSGESDAERAAISSFGRALGALLVPGATPLIDPRGADAASLRNLILRNQPFVRLSDLLSVCWSMGTPAVHLRVFPRPQKRMAAMAVRVAGHGAILLAKDSSYPAHIAFYLAHELGHLLLGHLDRDAAIVDLESTELGADEDTEDHEADRFALELLTGTPDPRVLPMHHRYNAPALAAAVLDAGPKLRVEPGTLALCFGFTTRKWPVVNAAMRFIYQQPKPVWKEVNAIAFRELDFRRIPEDTHAFIGSVLGAGAP